MGYGNIIPDERALEREKEKKIKQTSVYEVV